MPPTDPFGTWDDRPVTRHTLGSDDGVVLRVLDLGAIVQELWVPDDSGARVNVVLGFADVAGYLGAPEHYFGAVVGRFANRIDGGTFELGGRRYELARNEGVHTLHGGPDGFHRRIWERVSSDEGHLSLRLVSPDGDQGFPGRLTVTVTYLVAGSDVRIEYAAETDATTVVNLTQHAHFNLSGEGSGTVEGHELRVAADQFHPVGPDLIPTGEAADVSGTPFDFRSPVPIGARIREGHEQIRRGRGYDHDFVLSRQDSAAVLTDPRSGRTLTVDTDQPGVQVYTTNFLDGSHFGTSGRAYRQGDGVALETQHFPDAPHHPDWPSTVLQPRETFTSATVWRFGHR